MDLKFRDCENVKWDVQICSCGFPSQPDRSCRRASLAWLGLRNFTNRIFTRLKNFSCKYKIHNKNHLRIKPDSIAALISKGQLDPRELIQLYPGMQPILGIDFHSQLHPKNKSSDLRSRWEEDRSLFLRYICFLEAFLRTARETQQGPECVEKIDSALLRLYVELGDANKLQRFVASPNKCELELCVPVLVQSKR